MVEGSSFPKNLAIDPNSEYAYTVGVNNTQDGVISKIRLSDNTKVAFTDELFDVLIYKAFTSIENVPLGPIIVDPANNYVYVLSPATIYKVSITTGVVTNAFYPPFGQFAGDMAISNDNIPYIYASFFGGGISPPVISTSYPYVAKINTSTGAVFNILVSKDEYYGSISSDQ